MSYTPSKTNYEITNDLTGCTGQTGVCNGLDKQSINPSELNLWRIIRKNSDGSIEMVSEYTSSTQVYFYGKEGYKNLIGSLNTIAKQYETEGITIDSRYFGYHNQTQNLNTIDVFNCSTSGTPLENAPNGICTLPPIEKLGGGDDFEKIPDGELVKKACGTLITKSIKDEKVVNYYVASRAVDRYGNYCSRLINSSGEPDGIGFLTLTFQIFISPKSFLRPIVVLNSNLQSNGNGTKENPWKVN